MSDDVRLAVSLGLLLILAVAAQSYGRLRLRAAVLTAALRAVVQLAAVGLVIRSVFAAPAASVAVLAVMAAVATRTAARRLSELPGAGRAVVIASLSAAALTLGVLFAVPALPRSPRYLVALGGIVLGGTMTACTLAGRRLLDGLRRRRDEVEAWLALGATPRQAVADIARTAASEALLPALDQTRTVGLVTLPGAFVGALLGGASPLAAARFQLVVLIALLAAETYAAVVLVWLLGAPTQLPAFE
ncbi:ABC transporter permease [Frankia sp. AgB1.9]|uniref:ABC transporter permease n=1 Tax=unclassified Frankia TaxID=2632575 RepID=UPI0019333C1F|nr:MULTISPECIES: ABC transporter permease [unclassified Frankia]MBL7490157.1 ABC transporter permease [Frankia sp. AgW1.1]MBL7548243.1 ABC transporter permease [Frankia sp. AgB1.9]MBL7618912.1 ABC transporter permease [Frankia sp. AgB1.8]